MKNTLTHILLLFLFTSINAQTDEYLIDELLKCNFRTNCIDINADETKLLIGGEDEAVRVYDLNSKKMTFETTAHFQPVVKVKFSEKYGGFYTVGDKSFKLWMEGAEKPEKIYTGSKTSITDWDLTPDENVYVGGAFEKKFRYWKHEELKLPQTIVTNQSKNVISIATTNNGKLIACGSYDKTIELWDMESSSRQLKIDAHAMPVCCVNFTKNEKHLISASHDGTAKLWDIHTGENIKVYSNHIKAISDIAISPNGHFLLSASYDHSINLYSIASGDLIYKFKHHEAPVLDVIWNDTGTAFYSCDKEGQILHWSVAPKVFVDYYYASELNTEIKNNTLFEAKRKGESRSDYKMRQAKADAEMQKLITSYYLKYLDQLQKQSTVY